MGRQLHNEIYNYHLTVLLDFEEPMKTLIRGNIDGQGLCGKEPWTSLRSGIYILILENVLTSHVTLSSSYALFQSLKWV